MTTTALRDFQALSDDYGRYHVTNGNRLCHSAGIPLIMLAVVKWTQVGIFPWAALVLPLYFVWNARLAVAMTGVLVAMAALAFQMSPLGACVAFVAGWTLQLLGHAVFEGRSPAFTENLAHLFVGPMWVLREFIGLGSK